MHPHPGRRISSGLHSTASCCCCCCWQRSMVQCAAPTMQHCCAQAPQHEAHTHTHSSPNPKSPSPPATTPCHPSHTSHHKQHTVDARTRGYKTHLASDRKKPWLASTSARVLQSSSSLRTAAAKGRCCKALRRATLHPRPLCAAQRQQAQRAPGSWCANAHARAQQGCCCSGCCCACRCRKAPPAIGYIDTPPAGTNPACSQAAGAHAAAWHPLACLAHTRTHSGSTQVTHRHTQPSTGWEPG